MRATGDEVGNLVERADATSSAHRSAVEGSGGAGKFQLTVEGPVIQESVDEAGVEDVACTSGIDYGDAEGWGVEELSSVEGENTFLAEGCCGKATRVSALHLAESLFEIGLGCEARGEVAADDEVVDVTNEILDVGVEFVEVRDDGDVGFARPGGGQDGGFGVVTVDVKGTGVSDPIAIEIGGTEAKTVISADQDGAFALGIDEDQRLSAGGAGNSDNPGVDTGVGSGMREGFAVEGGGKIVTKFTDVASAETPMLAGDNGGGDLPAGQSADGRVFGLGATGGVRGKRDDRVGGVEANADEVNLRGFCHVLTVNELPFDRR